MSKSTLVYLEQAAFLGQASDTDVWDLRIVQRYMATVFFLELVSKNSPSRCVRLINKYGEVRHFKTVDAAIKLCARNLPFKVYRVFLAQ